MKRLALVIVLMVGSVTGGFAAPGDSATDTTSATIATMPLPLSMPLTPLPSGALTNFNAVQTNWFQIENRILTGDSTMPERPWIMLERKRFGGMSDWDEYYMHDWERTPELIRQQQQNRAALGPNGKPIKK